MKKFEVLDKGNKRFVLTVTPYRVTIKLQENSSPGLCERVIRFLKWVANQPELNAPGIAFRGRTDVPLNDKGLMIQMISVSGKQKHTYYENNMDENYTEPQVA